MFADSKIFAGDATSSNAGSNPYGVALAETRTSGHTKSHALVKGNMMSKNVLSQQFSMRHTGHIGEKSVYNTMDPLKDGADSLQPKKSFSLGKKTSQDYALSNTEVAATVNDQAAFDENHSAKAPKRRIHRHVSSTRALDVRSLKDKTRFVIVDRRGDLKQYHLKEERSMREIAAVRMQEQEREREIFEEMGQNLPESMQQS